MENMEMEVKEGVLTITIDLSKDLGLSKSGKNTIIATSRGNHKIPGRDTIIGLTIYRKAT